MKRMKVALLLVLVALLVLPAAAQRKSRKTPAVAKSSQEKPVVIPVADDRITIEQLKAKLDAGAQIMILDVRASEDWNSSLNKIKGAVRVPVEDVDRKKTEWNKATEIITYCSCTDEATSASVVRALKRDGFKNMKALTGGWKAWEKAGFSVEPK